jgi:hypothetical protein
MVFPNTRFHIVQDASASMLIDDCSGRRTRWEAVQEVACGLVHELGQKVPITFFQGIHTTTVSVGSYSEAQAVYAAIRPASSTPMDKALRDVIDAAKHSDLNTVAIMLFDGVPDDKLAVERLLREQANAQATDERFTLLIAQVGNDQRGKEWLTNLDTNLRASKDIVCVLPLDKLAEFPSITDLIAHAIAN